jgi:hypothetical protein
MWKERTLTKPKPKGKCDDKNMRGNFNQLLQPKPSFLIELKPLTKKEKK